MKSFLPGLKQIEFVASLVDKERKAGMAPQPSNTPKGYFDLSAEKRAQIVAQRMSIQHTNYLETRARTAFAECVRRHPMHGKLHPNINLFVVWCGLVNPKPLQMVDVSQYGRGYVEAIGEYDILLRAMSDISQVPDMVNAVIDAAIRVQEEMVQ